MESRAINQKTWINAFGLNQAIEVKAGERTLYISGQTSNDAQGAPLHPGDIAAQFRVAWENICEVLEAAGMRPANIVRLNMYTTDVDAFMAAAEDLVPIWSHAGCMPTSTLLGVEKLFQPEILIELEATAVA